MASAASGNASTNGVMVNGHAATGETKKPLAGAAEALEPTQSKWVRSRHSGKNKNNSPNSITQGNFLRKNSINR